VIIGTTFVGGGFGTTMAGKFVLTTGATGFETVFVPGQFAGGSPDERSGGVVEQPARKISAQKMIPAVLNTRPFC
jgi:hypothetical protein